MTFIRNAAPPQDPMVTISAPASSRQVRVAFNAALVRAAGLDANTHVAIDYDEKARTVEFITCKASTRGIPNDARFPLMRDGGQKTKSSAGRAIYMHRNQASDLVAGRYPAEFKRNRDTTRVKICLDPKFATYASAQAVPSRICGVYRLIDGAGQTVDIGLSESDVRGRIRTKWSNEPEVVQVQVYPLPSETQCAHWERVFHNRHVKTHGCLPKYCEAIGAGCGCDLCAE